MARGHKTGGRQKGTPNKLTKDLRELVRAALDAAGGEHYLIEQARENPAAFMTLVGKCLPKEITGGDGGAILHAHKVIWGKA